MSIRRCKASLTVSGPYGPVADHIGTVRPAGRRRPERALTRRAVLVRTAPDGPPARGASPTPFFRDRVRGQGGRPGRTGRRHPPDRGVTAVLPHGMDGEGTVLAGAVEGGWRRTASLHTPPRRATGRHRSTPAMPLTRAAASASLGCDVRSESASPRRGWDPAKECTAPPIPGPGEAPHHGVDRGPVSTARPVRDGAARPPRPRRSVPSSAARPRRRRGEGAGAPRRDHPPLTLLPVVQMMFGWGGRLGWPGEWRAETDEERPRDPQCPDGRQR